MLVCKQRGCSNTSIWVVPQKFRAFVPMIGDKGFFLCLLTEANTLCRQLDHAIYAYVIDFINQFIDNCETQ